MSEGRKRLVSISALSLAVATLFLLAGAAGATVYTVTLKNGTTIDSRYQPEEASWDPDKVVLMTEFGNRIALSAADIESVTVDSESRGFGHQLNASTMALGWAPNDAIDPNSDEGKAAAANEAAAAAAAATASPTYNQEQFVEPGQLSGLPVWMTGVNSVPQVQPAAPSAPAPLP